MKYINGAAVILIVLTNLIVCSIETEAIERSKDVLVTYNNATDETNKKEPSDNEETPTPSYLVSTPAYIKFSDEDKIVDTSVRLLNKDGSSFNKKQSSVKLEVELLSKNDYKLVLEKDHVKDEVAYVITRFDGEKITNNDSILGQLSNQETLLASEARLIGKAKKSGNHTDLLTYKIAIK